MTFKPICLCSSCNQKECIKKENRYVQRTCVKCSRNKNKKNRDKYKYQGCLITGIKICRICNIKKGINEFSTVESRTCLKCLKENTQIKSNLRNRVYSALKAQNTKKSKTTEELIGCSIEFLKYYLESLFRDGMNWNNRGLRGWHIDHIRPCKSFNLKNLEEQRKCFHYTNLQPLWWWENLSKGSKWLSIM